MKESNEKKITTFKVFRVIMIIYTIIIIAVLIQTVYGWVTGIPDTNNAYLAATAATYCATAAMYEEQKKKEKAKKKEAEKAEA